MDSKEVEETFEAGTREQRRIDAKWLLDNMKIVGSSGVYYYTIKLTKAKYTQLKRLAEGK